MALKKRTALSLLAAAGTAAAIVAVLPFTAAGGPAGLPLPDLRSAPPEGQTTPEVYSDGSLIVRFDGYVNNYGPGPLHLEGNPQTTSADDRPKQFVFDPANYRGDNPPIEPGTLAADPDDRPGWQAVASPEVLFETADGHNHFHYMRIAEYSLWNKDRTAEVAPAQKVGFCLYDIGGPIPSEPFQTPLKFGLTGGGNFITEYNGGGDFCRQNQQNSTSLQMGISPGWRDLYGSYLALQWVNISDTAPGEYYLASEADPENRVVEADENNAVAYSNKLTIVPGYNALALAASTPFQAPVDLTLASEKFAHPNLTLGSLAYRIVRPPANGTLNAPTNSNLGGPGLTYTPNPGFTGVDSFEYIAQDQDSNYPLNPRRASGVIQVGANPAPAPAPAPPPEASPDLTVAALSGAPSNLFVGTSAQLSTLVIGGPQGIAWSVNGAVGGNSEVGTVSPTGLYIAPATVPSGGTVTVRATSISNPAKFSEVAITILPAPTVRPRPGKPRSLAEPRVVSARGAVSVLNTSKVAGRYHIVARYLKPGKKIRVLGRCSATRPAGKSHRCKIRYPKSLNRKFVQVLITFNPRTGGKRVVRKVGPTKIGKVRFAVTKKGALKNRRINVRTRSTRSGLLNFVVRHNTKVVRRCRIRVVAGQNVRCQVTLKRGQKLKRVRASVVLRAEDGLRVRRNARI